MTFKQMAKQMTIVVIGSLRVKQFATQSTDFRHINRKIIVLNKSINFLLMCLLFRTSMVRKGVPIFRVNTIFVSGRAPDKKE